MFNKPEGKRVGRKTKGLSVSSFRDVSHKTTQGIFKSDHVESFGTVPGPILREYWTNNEAV